jgi:hypothetical protein
MSHSAHVRSIEDLFTLATRQEDELDVEVEVSDT